LIRAEREVVINRDVTTSFIHIEIEGGFVCVHQSFLFRPGTNEIVKLSESSCFVPFGEEAGPEKPIELKGVEEKKTKPFISNAQLEVMKLEGKA